MEKVWYTIMQTKMQNKVWIMTSEGGKWYAGAFLPSDRGAKVEAVFATRAMAMNAKKEREKYAKSRRFHIFSAVFIEAPVA